MFNYLLEKSRKKTISVILAAVIVTVLGIWFFSISNILELLNGTYNNAIPLTYDIESFEGKYVEYETDIAFDYFSYYEARNHQFDERLYAIPIWDTEGENFKLIGLEVSTSRFKLMDSITNNTINMIESETYDESQFTDVLSTKGTIKKMDSIKYKYFVEAYEGTDFELMPYILLDNRHDDEKGGYLILGSVLIIIGVFLIIYRGLQLKFLYDEDAVKDYISNTGDFEEVEEDCSHGTVTPNNIYIGKKYIAFANYKPIVLLLEDILWVYGQTQSYNFIRVSSQIMIRDKNGKLHTVNAKKRDFDSILVHFFNANNKIICGYNDELARIYRKDKDEFIRMGEEQEKEYEKQTFS